MAGNCCDTSSWISQILNKILAALGQLTKATTDNKITVVEYPICDNGVQKIALVTYKNGIQTGALQYFDKAHNTIAPPVDFSLVAFGECGGSAVVPGLVLPQFTVPTAPGTIAAGAQSVEIKNTGNAPGAVLGRVFYQGETFKVEGYLDEVSKVFRRLDAISYDATNTEFHIIVIP